ncbi:MAG: UvrD-helicase domain-containing protein [Clostridiales bacterium]|nr:UvrD-helicase domain-containing protein [Clostridiales bacterium]
MIDHPAAREETAHLNETLEIVAQQQLISAEELTVAKKNLQDTFRFERDNMDLLGVRQIMFDRSEQAVRNMAAARLRPYFTRVNFTEESGVKQVYYIGKHSVFRPNSVEPAVIDWRSPIANLYYSGQVGKMHYVAPDGEVRGELTLKRQFGIENGELISIFDTDVVSKDAYLQSVLGATTGERLRDIVTSIQAEQNIVIRHPANVTLVVQGVAGSGKTTIALHRIAYLLYTLQDSLRPEHVLILAPNPLFLNFIAGVLPDLGVEKVRQTTFPLLVSGWLGKLLPRVNTADQTDRLLALPPDEREDFIDMMHYKGSLEFTRRLDQWLDAFEERLPPQDALKFGPFTLFTPEQTRAFLVEGEKPFPFAVRIERFKKELTQRAKEAAGKVNAWLEAETQRRADALHALPDSPQRRERLFKLYQSRDQRLKETNERVRPFVDEVMKAFPALRPIELYRAFLTDLLSESDPDSPVCAAAEYTLKRVGSRVEPEDVAPIALIALRAHPLERMDIRHIVIDEAQDFSPAEFLLLRRMTHNAPMTVVGDLMQGIRSWRGLTDWRTLTDDLLGGKAVTHALVTSYRNTVEIMNTALRVALKRPVPGQTEVKPVLRHGPEPEIIAFSKPAEQTAQIERLIRGWQSDNVKTIAVIDRTDAQLKALLKALPADLNARILDVNGELYEGGVLLARAGDIKGFEFDGVIIANASEARFPNTELDARLLYVCLTRPLHRLACLYEKTLTPLLAE